jgi:putative protein-disulfide isomerase
MIEITYYTDPLCCWSWSFEPQWRRLRYEYEGRITWRYCMGGLLPDWTKFVDSTNNISRPVQMGPLWMEASVISGMPIEHSVWLTNAPSSSYAACIAVKAAGLQSMLAEERYLRLLREAIMIKGINISHQRILLQIAHELSTQHPDILNFEMFKSDINGDVAKEAFRSDLQECRYYGINRFPTLIFRKAQNPPVIFTGYRSYQALVDSLKKASPEIEKTKREIDAEEYLSFWNSLLPREKAEINPLGNTAKA